jgi:hypothetical protein
MLTQFSMTNLAVVETPLGWGMLLLEGSHRIFGGLVHGSCFYQVCESIESSTVTETHGKGCTPTTSTTQYFSPLKVREKAGAASMSSSASTSYPSHARQIRPGNSDDGSRMAMMRQNEICIIYLQ